MTKKIEVFASEALPGELEDFPDIKRGWGTTKESTGGIPPMKWFNAVQKRTDEWLLYLTQRGIPEWDASLDYSKGALSQVDGVIYRAKEAVKGENPTTSAKWEKLFSDKVGTSDFIGMSQNAVKKELDKKVSAADLTQTITGDTLKAPSNFAVNTALKEQDPRRWGFGGRGDTWVAPGTPQSSAEDTILSKFTNMNEGSQIWRSEVSTVVGRAFAPSIVCKTGDTWANISVSYSSLDVNVVAGNLKTSSLNVSTLYGTANTSIDPNGVLTTKQDTVTLTTNDLAKETGNSHSKVMTQKAATDAFPPKCEGYPVGAPIPWPQATAPAGFLVCNGQSFNKTTYPLLALAYPSGVLPDLRGEFIRGWDDGRGVDQGRSLLSNQSDAFASHNHYIRTTSGGISPEDDGDPTRGQLRGTANTAGGVGSDKSIGMSGGSETRPRNIAFNYIVRAA